MRFRTSRPDPWRYYAPRSERSSDPAMWRPELRPPLLDRPVSCAVGGGSYRTWRPAWSNTGWPVG
jgi:hypothetical protein